MPSQLETRARRTRRYAAAWMNRPNPALFSTQGFRSALARRERLRQAIENQSTTTLAHIESIDHQLAQTVARGEEVDQEITRMQEMVAQDWATSRTELLLRRRAPLVHLPTSQTFQEPPAEIRASHRELHLPQQPPQPVSMERALVRYPSPPSDEVPLTARASATEGIERHQSERRGNRGNRLISTRSLSSSPRRNANWVPSSSIRRGSSSRPPGPTIWDDSDTMQSPDSDPENIPEAESRVLPARRLATSLSPNRQMCKVRALEVQVGDKLMHGDRANNGCKVTQCHPKDPDSNEAAPMFSPVKLNGPIRIEWENKRGLKVGRDFGGMEELYVMRVIGKSDWREEDLEGVVHSSDRDER